MSLTSSLMTLHDRTANSSTITTGAVAKRAGENPGFQIRSPTSDYPLTPNPFPTIPS